MKQQVLTRYARTYNLRIFVETGTYYGDTVEALRAQFDRIYSIELSRDLHEKAKERFKTAANVELIHGDSGTELERIVKALGAPALFWLDGHYSAGETARGDKDTPILEELTHILEAGTKGHVIVIDDARCFGTERGYPTVDELKRFIKSKKGTAQICVEDDSIRVTEI